MVKLTVLLVTYNHELYIRECIESILMQKTSFDYEIIVADDYSFDNTISIVKEHTCKSKVPFRILETSQNLGLIKNYQRAFNACAGEYVAVLEGDDYWTSPDRLQKHVDFLEAHRECAMSFNRKLMYLEEKEMFQIDSEEIDLHVHYVTAQNLASGNCIGNFSTCVYRKSVLDKLDPDLFKMNISDWMINLAVAQHGLIAALGEIMTVYRVQQKGEWSKMDRITKLRLELEATDQYNDYFKYKYAAEFGSLKKYLISELKKAKGIPDKSIKQQFIDYTPPVLIFLLKQLIPRKFRKS